MIKLGIDLFDIYSPNIGDSEIIVNLNLGKILILFDPYTVNEIVKFFRNVRTSTFRDLESY